MTSSQKSVDRFSVSIPPDLNSVFESLRVNLKISRSDAVQKAIRLFIDHETLHSSLNPQKTILGSITYLENEHIHAHLDENHTIDDLKAPDSEDKKKKYYIHIEQYEYIQITELEHHFSDIILSTTHLHVDATKCMIIIGLKGPFQRVNTFITQLTSYKTIKKIQFSLIEIIE